MIAALAFFWICFGVLGTAASIGEHLRGGGLPLDRHDCIFIPITVALPPLAWGLTASMIRDQAIRRAWQS